MNVNGKMKELQTAILQKVFFHGVDDPAKIKSIKPSLEFIGIIIFEELNQFSREEEVRMIEQSAIRAGSGAYIFWVLTRQRAKATVRINIYRFPKIYDGYTKHIS